MIHFDFFFGADWLDKMADILNEALFMFRGGQADVSIWEVGEYCWSCFSNGLWYSGCRIIIIHILSNIIKSLIWDWHNDQLLKYNFYNFNILEMMSKFVKYYSYYSYQSNIFFSSSSNFFLLISRVKCLKLLAKPGRIPHSGEYSGQSII